MKVECHYFIINLSPFASALEHDQCQWQNNFGNHRFYFSYHDNLWTLMFFILEPVDAANELPFHFCHLPGEMEYCIQTQFCKTENAYDFVHWYVSTAVSVSLLRSSCQKTCHIAIYTCMKFHTEFINITLFSTVSVAAITLYSSNHSAMVFLYFCHGNIYFSS